MLEIRRDSETVVDWVNGHSKLKTKQSTIASGQNLLGKWWARGLDLRHRVAQWATHIFREHKKEADSWAGKGVKGRDEEWADTANVARSEVSGLCGFWDDSCESGTCGAGITIQAFTKTLGCPIRKKCGLARGPNSLDAELGGCGVLMDTFESLDRPRFA